MKRFAMGVLWFLILWIGSLAVGGVLYSSFEQLDKPPLANPPTSVAEGFEQGYSEGHAAGYEFAFIQVGLASSVRGPGNFLQCVSQNPDLAAGNSTAPSPNAYTGSSGGLGNNGFQFIVNQIFFPGLFVHGSVPFKCSKRCQSPG